jgi:hypothetical protein
LKKIVIIGGTGHFGGRICRRLVAQAGAELTISSRSLSRAQEFVDELVPSGSTTTIRAAALDQSSHDFESRLLALRPDVVIHTAGPYQGQDYRVAKACIQAGSHYIDLADGRDFVSGFAALNDDATRNNLLLVSGASTLPGLSSVVIDSLRDRFDAIRKIEISIAPAHQTPRGKSTISAVLSYCGMPVPMLIAGKWETKHGWQDIRRHRYPDFGMRLSAACDVPDLELLPAYVNGVDTVTFHAALESKLEQITLWTMGWITRAGIVKNWDGFVPMFDRVSDRLISFGSEVGGMHIKVSGNAKNGEPLSLTWNLVARQNHGPEIPCSPALILARKLLAHEISTRGAVPCLGMFSLSDFATELTDFDVHWEVNEP